jgi:exosortase
MVPNLMSTPSPDPLLRPAGEDSAPRSGLASIRDYAARMATPRNAVFLFLVIVSILTFWTPLMTLLHYSLREDKQYDQYTYTMAIPFITAVLVFFDKRGIFARVQYCYPALILLLAAAAMPWSVAQTLPQLSGDASLSLKLLGLVIFWLAGFVLCYGTPAIRAGLFPLAFLFLTVPLPDSVLEKPVTAVQYGSTDVCSLIFSLTGVPYLRDGLRFFLPHNSIEVARECSGIHSTFAILIISLVAGHLFLSSVWKKVVLILCALPIVCITNGFRIAGLTLLAEYVDGSFLHGRLHHQGGVCFFLMALLLLSLVLGVLRRGATPRAARQAWVCTPR